MTRTNHWDHKKNTDDVTTDNDDGSTPVVMIPCEDCGHFVPESNLTIHQATACGARARHSSSVPQIPSVDTPLNMLHVDEAVSAAPSLFGLRQRRPTSPASTTTAATASTAINPSSIGILDSESLRQQDQQHHLPHREHDNLVDLTSEHDDRVNADATPSTNGQRDEDEEWACPRCTLLNSLSETYCNACRYHDQTEEVIRPPDATRRERLIDPSFHRQDVQPFYSNGQQRDLIHDPSGSRRNPNNDDNNSHTTTTMATSAGGAMVGIVLGAAGAYMNGRSLSNGAMQGAVTGLVGGVVLGEILRDLQPPLPPTQSLSTTTTTTTTRTARSDVDRGSGGARGHTHTTTTQMASRAGRTQPHELVHVVRRSNLGGREGITSVLTFDNGVRTTTTSTEDQQSSAEHAAHHDQSDAYDDTNNGLQLVMGGGHNPLLNLMMHALTPIGDIGGGGSRNIDGMSYEQLLTAFGDGTEHMGAQEEDIHSLPTSKIQNAEGELPENARNCAVCLEDFKQGHVRKVLPCLHGFHQECIDKWLRSNGSCPICKHKLT